MLSALLGEFGDLLHEDGDLNEFDVVEERVPEDVGINHDESRSSLTVLEEGDHGDVVFRHDAVEDIVFSLHIWTVDGDGCKVNHFFTETYVLATLPEGRTTVHSHSLALCHSLCPRLRREITFIIVIGEFAPEHLRKVLLVEFLKADKICIILFDLLQNELASVVPVERLRGGVTVLSNRRILVTEDVVR